MSSSSRLPRTGARDRPEALPIVLREALRAMEEELVARLAARGHEAVRLPHGNVLQYLDDAGTHVSVLAERAGMTKQGMAQLVTHLERHGYVERVPDPADGRAKLVRATARSGDVYAIARELIGEVDERVARRLGAQGARDLRAMLEALREAVSPG